MCCWTYSMSNANNMDGIPGIGLSRRAQKWDVILAFSLTWALVSDLAPPSMMDWPVADAVHQYML